MRTILQPFEEVFPELPSDFGRERLSPEDTVTKVLDQFFEDEANERLHGLKPNVPFSKSVVASVTDVIKTVGINADTEIACSSDAYGREQYRRGRELRKILAT